MTYCLYGVSTSHQKRELYLLRISDAKMLLINPGPFLFSKAKHYDEAKTRTQRIQGVARGPWDTASSVIRELI